MWKNLTSSTTLVAFTVRAHDGCSFGGQRSSLAMAELMVSYAMPCQEAAMGVIFQALVCKRVTLSRWTTSNGFLLGSERWNLRLTKG